MYKTHTAISNKRGPTRYLSTCKKRRVTKTLVVEVDQCAGRLVGTDSPKLITKTGCIAREFAVFDGTGFKHQDDGLKKKIISKCAVRY